MVKPGPLDLLFNSFLTEGQPIWSPFLTLFKIIFTSTLEFFSFMRSRAGWSLVLSGSWILLAALGALSILLSNFLISNFLLPPFTNFINFLCLI